MNKLKKILKESNIKYSDICKSLNIKSSGTVSLKINGKAYFTTKEAISLKKMINEKTGKTYSLEDLFELNE